MVISPVTPRQLIKEAFAAELDELPTPYKYEVKPFHLLKLRPLREQIERVGISVYPEIDT